MTDERKPIPINGVSIREVYALIQDVLEEQRRMLTEIKNEMREQDEKRTEEMNKLSREIYGEAETRGLRGRVTDLERNVSILHSLQIAVSAVLAAIAAWWGSKN